MNLIGVQGDWGHKIKCWRRDGVGGTFVDKPKYLQESFFFSQLITGFEAIFNASEGRRRAHSKHANV